MIFCESQIKGSFNGFKDRGTVFELTNGRVFQQDEFKFHYYYAYRPSVRVFQEGSTFYLEVEGMKDRVKVKKIK